MADLYVPDVTDMDTCRAALAYAAAGFYLLPVKMATKHPGSVVRDDWQSKSSRDPKQIAAWFPGTDYGIALHLGRSGAVAIDIDHPAALPDVLRDACADAPFQSTRTSDPARGHALFVMPSGRDIGNGNGRLGKGWGDVRGRNGVTIVAPSTHADAVTGGRYAWTRTGPLDVLPDAIAELLDDATDAVDAATDAAVTEFLCTHATATRPALLNVWCEMFARDVAAGASRHTSMVAKLAGAMKEAAAGYLDAGLAVDTLRSMFLAAIAKRPVGDDQGAPRIGAIANGEFAGMLAWAIGQATVADLDAVRARVAEKVPELPAWEPPAPPPVTLAEVHDVFRRWLGDEFDLDSLDAMLATAAVEQLDGDPVWLLLISGSGNAKTETVQSLDGAGALVTSTITSPGALLSASPAKEKAKDATGGLLRKVGAHGVIVIKDVTSILSMDRNMRGEVLGALREVYDGRWSRNVGTDGGRTLDWTGRLVVIGAVTTAWDKAHDVIASMGARFVLLRMDSTIGRQVAGRRAIGNTGSEPQMRTELAEAVGGVLATVDPTIVTRLDDAETEILLAAADVVTLARTGVEHDYRGDVIDAHAPEMPTRFAKQLTQIVRGGVAIGMDRTAALRLAIRCARDSIPPLRLAIIDDVAVRPHSTTADVRRRLNKPRATVDRQLQALHMLGVLDCDEEPTTWAGRDATRMVLHPRRRHRSHLTRPPISARYVGRGDGPIGLYSWG